MTETDATAVESTPEFRAGFDFARKIADPAFRDWLAAIGWRSGATICPAVASTPIGDVLSRLESSGAHADAWIAVVDPDAEHGFRMLRITEPTTTAKESP